MVLVELKELQVLGAQEARDGRMAIPMKVR
jgi:hypothetical protein